MRNIIFGSRHQSLQDGIRAFQKVLYILNKRPDLLDLIIYELINSNWRDKASYLVVQSDNVIVEH